MKSPAAHAVKISPVKPPGMMPVLLQPLTYAGQHITITSNSLHQVLNLQISSSTVRCALK